MRRRTWWIAAAGGVMLATAIGAHYGWRQWRRQQVARIVAAAVPSTPDTAGWPGAFAARVLVVTLVAPRLENPVPALQELAGLYHANGRYAAARQVELGLQSLQPNEPRWMAWLADAEQNLGDMPAAQSWLERAVAQAPADPALRLKLAEWNFKRGDMAGAEVEYRQRLARIPADPYARFGLARIALRRGDRAAARAQLEQIVADAPDFPVAHNLLAAIYEQDGDQRRAAEQRELGSAAGRFREASDPWLARINAWSYDKFVQDMPGVPGLRRQALQTSVAVYREAVRLMPKEPAAFEALSDVYTGLGWIGGSGETIDESDPMARGRRVYLAVCFACHQPNGEGVPGAFPPLANSDFLRVDRDRALRVPLHGLNGAIVVNGATYNAIMPPQTQLNTTQIADVMTYVMNSWGNQLGPVKVDEVERARVGR